MLMDDIKRVETAELEFNYELPSGYLKFLKTAVAYANCNGDRIFAQGWQVGSDKGGQWEVLV